MSTESTVSTGLPAAAIAALHEGRKIDAIKIVRVEARVGLKEAKERVADYVARNPHLQEQLASSPGTSGFSWLFMLLVAIAAIVYFWPD